MPAAELSTRSCTTTVDLAALPEVLQTPTGLALLEIQGTVHLPPGDEGMVHEIGTLSFAEKTAWLWVGNRQRMEGKIVELKPPLGIMRRAETDTADAEDGSTGTAVEIIDVIRHKVVFKTRPEPMVLGRE
ncbi:Ctf8-domain-containing protein [Dipodascopsis tothii]|uniref:Ctf8-domain-containing protein n=1 Tax=Dipodascopsis tothii TaxID=44089 RepID=UPI0034D01A0C